jgi:hypothetical protein
MSRSITSYAFTNFDGKPYIYFNGVTIDEKRNYNPLVTNFTGPYGKNGDAHRTIIRHSTDSNNRVGKVSCMLNN